MSPPKDARRGTIAAREFARQEGVDPKAVRRALQIGRLQAGADGRPFADQVGNGWHRARRTGGDIGGDTSAKSPDCPHDVPSAAGDLVDPEEVVQRADEFVEDVLAGRFKSLPDAIAVKENALALKHMLEARKRANALVDRQAVLDACFKRARNERNAWLNWPSRVAPLVAADLGLEPDRVNDVLAAVVHQHLADLGDPDLDLDEEDRDDAG